MRWRYAYPQAEFPYDDLVAENARRGRTVGEYELLDTGAFADGRYWDVTVDYAKAAPDDLCIRMTIRNAGPERASIDVLPTLWFRNRWSWDPGATKPKIGETDGALVGRSRRPGPDRACGRRQPRAAVLRQREQHASPVGRRRAAVSQGRDQRSRRRRRGDRQSGPDRHQGCAALSPRGRRRPVGRDPPAARARAARPRPTRGRPRCARGRKRPTTSTRRSRRPRPPTSSW